MQFIIFIYDLYKKNIILILDILSICIFMENIICVYFKFIEIEVRGSLCFKFQMYSDFDYYKYLDVFVGCRFKNS